VAARTPRVLLYKTGRCPHCRQARDFLQRHHIPFLEQDVERNRRALKEFQRLGARGVPVILVGQQRLDGFDPGRLRRVLKGAGFRI